jgi:F-type H+-transporting ATPase subunit gamma
MPAITKIIKNRIKSVSNIKKITRAMEMVAASKMKKATERAVSSREFTILSLEMLVNILREREVDHYLMSKRKKGKKVVVVITSNKGLCSSYNVNVFKKLKSYIDENKDSEIELVTIGKYAERYARKLEKNIIASFIDFSDNVNMREMNGLFKIVFDEFSKKDCQSVDLIFTNYISAMSNQTLVHNLLPVHPENIMNFLSLVGPAKTSGETGEINNKSLAKYIFEPNETQVVARVLPILIETQIYQSLVESQASEHSVRMMAMRNASESADEMVDELALSLNQARQAAITQEISEIAGGALALNG